MEDWQENIKKARQHFQIADHMTYVSFVILKENRLMIKIINELYISATSLIKAILKYEEDRGNVRLYTDSNLNFRTFKGVYKKYISEEEFKNLVLIMRLERQHKDSPMEFVKKDTLVIMNEDRYETINIEKLREIAGRFRISLNKVQTRLT